MSEHTATSEWSDISGHRYDRCGKCGAPWPCPDYRAEAAEAEVERLPSIEDVAGAFDFGATLDDLERSNEHGKEWLTWLDQKPMEVEFKSGARWGYHACLGRAEDAEAKLAEALAREAIKTSALESIQWCLRGAECPYCRECSAFSHLNDCVVGQALADLNPAAALLLKLAREGVDHGIEYDLIDAALADPTLGPLLKEG